MMRPSKYTMLILGAAFFTGCTQKATRNEANRPAAYCAGRYLVEGPPSMRIDSSNFTYYWGDITTWRENSSAYSERLAQVQAAAERAGTLARPVMRTADNSGMLMFTYEEDAPPFDPNTTLLYGYAHRDGVTVEFKKRTVNRLLGVAELRTREIIKALGPRPSRLNALTNEVFCAGDGVIKRIPQAGWYEAAEISGRFSIGSHNYKFLFSVHPLKSPELHQNDLSGRRETVAEIAGAIQLQREAPGIIDKTKPGGAPTQATMQLLSAQDSKGREFVIYEWQGALGGNGNNPMKPYFYIWSVADMAGKLSDSLLVKAAAESSTNRPLYIRFAQHVPADETAAASASVQEESQVPYSMRIMYQGPPAPVQDVRYRIFRNGDQVAEGRSDRNGFTEAMNADYLETWEIETCRDLAQPIHYPRSAPCAK